MGIAGDVGWGAALAATDSDEDGFTNGEELQDPNGAWRPGDPALGNSALVTSPGNASSKPAVVNHAPVVDAIGNKTVQPEEVLEFILSATDFFDIFSSGASCRRVAHRQRVLLDAHRSREWFVRSVVHRDRHRTVGFADREYHRLG